MDYTSQNKVIKHLEEIEEAGEMVLAKQQQCIVYDRNRQKSREAMRKLIQLNSENKQWTCLSDQFFLFPSDQLKKAIEEDIKVYDSEIQKLKDQLKEDINWLHELEGKESLKGFDLLPLKFMTSLLTFGHRRYNPLLDEWVIVSPQRIQRPWVGQIESDNQKSTEVSVSAKDAKNPLSPGSVRASGIITPDYQSVYTFYNDFPALVNDSRNCENNNLTDYKSVDENPLFAYAPAQGDCLVTCFHPDSSKTLTLMEQHEILSVISEWCRITEKYLKMKKHRWLQIFENRGAVVGSSNTHPHSQIWACDFLPSLVSRRDKNQQNYALRHNGKPLLLDYAIQEEMNMNNSPSNSRTIICSTHWLVIVPWWAYWPFETMILPRKRHILWLHELCEDEKRDLASVLQELLVRYDNLFNTEFPYSMGWYQAPMYFSEREFSEDLNNKYKHWQLHAVYLPPLLRSSTVRKFMSGFELLAETQRDLLPETAARMLRETSKNI
ncbi:Galactose-1-phosphate uridylyltransferase [Schistosoma japonicum]|nr:Galactose-1-phosphate uridylyltransferase [Schistosoma japonicum]